MHLLHVFPLLIGLGLYHYVNLNLPNLETFFISLTFFFIFHIYALIFLENIVLVEKLNHL